MWSTLPSMPSFSRVWRGVFAAASTVFCSFVATAQSVDARDHDVRHYDLSVTLPERGSLIRAKATLTVDRVKLVDTLRLDLTGLTVDRVTINNASREFARDSLTLRIPLKRADGARVMVAVEYHGAPSDGLIIREDSVRGWSAFGDNWPNRARFWIPSVDHPSDKATVSWTITAPSARAVLANGVRVGTPTSASTPAGERGSWRTTRFQLAQPIPTYLMVLGAANMQETSLGNTACGWVASGKCLPQSVWTFPQETHTMPGNFAEAGRIVSTFGKLIGPFAYARLTHVQSATKFGGMENATAIFYSDNAFRENRVGVDLIAHETAHQWFGDAVTPRHWEDLWLSEGFATYLAAVYAQKSRGDSAFYANMRRIRETVMAAAVVAERPVVDTVGAQTPLTLLNANSYQKGGFVLHMLRARIGDAAFFGALRDYQQRYRNGNAVTDDLRRLFEKRAGVSLVPFFDQWLHRPGFAELTITWTWSASKSALILAVMQSPRFAPVAVPLELVIRDNAGTARTITVQVDAQKQQTISIPLRGVREVMELDADPRVRVLGRVELLHAMP